MHRRVVVLLAAVCAVLLPVASQGQPGIPDVPKEVKVPPGHKLLFNLEAKGVQMYKAVEKSGNLEWELEAPLADLFDAKGGKAGCHYEGPSWEAVDGSKVVVHDKKVDVKSVKAPKPEQNIDWLLLKVKPAEGKEGELGPVVYIQRLHTEGGKPPAELPKRVGTKVGVNYKAIYYFYGEAK
jgi:hypothetical protein